MYRKIEQDLLSWKQEFNKPLMLVGARQTGKTYIIEKRRPKKVALKDEKNIAIL